MSKYIPKNIQPETISDVTASAITGSVNSVYAVCTSKRKGIAKKPVEKIELIVDYGIKDDAHAGAWHRQVSLLNRQKVEDFKTKSIAVPIGAFGENLLVEGYDVAKLPIGSKFVFDEVILQLTQIGKECHAGCAIRDQVGDCIMPREGVFAVVLKGGQIKAGDTYRIELPENLNIIATPHLTHLNAQGQAHMVDVSAKTETERTATVRGKIKLSEDAYQQILKQTAKKGDVLATARIAGIMATKRTAELIPLCHSLNLTGVSIELDTSIANQVVCDCSVKTLAPTGVEMEAFVGCSTALLTIYDMLKAIDRAMIISDLHLIFKSGGKSGTFSTQQNSPQGD